MDTRIIIFSIKIGKKETNVLIMHLIHLFAVTWSRVYGKKPITAI